MEFLSSFHGFESQFLSSRPKQLGSTACSSILPLAACMRIFLFSLFSRGLCVIWKRAFSTILTTTASENFRRSNRRANDFTLLLNTKIAPFTHNFCTQKVFNTNIDPYAMGMGLTPIQPLRSCCLANCLTMREFSRLPRKIVSWVAWGSILANYVLPRIFEVL